MPCKRALWEAPNSTVWKTEYEFGGSGETTILEVLELQRSVKINVKGDGSELLDTYYADVDGLGSLVLLSADSGIMDN
jgi:hypothetical protein